MWGWGQAQAVLLGAGTGAACPCQPLGTLLLAALLGFNSRGVSSPLVRHIVLKPEWVMGESRFIPHWRHRGGNVQSNQLLPLWKRDLWWGVKKMLPSLRAISLTEVGTWAC